MNYLGQQNIIPIGIDEAGRGPLAGPVCAACVVILENDLKILGGDNLISDSKTLSPKKRFLAYEKVLRHCAAFSVSMVGPKRIDKINIYEATKLAIANSKSILCSDIRRSLRSGIDIHKFSEGSGIYWGKSNIDKLSIVLKGTPKRFYSFVDGNMKFSNIGEYQSIVKGDSTEPIISAASIIAKVTRDKIMGKIAQKYPNYELGKHQGYPTKLHRELIQKHGACKIHRNSFKLLS